MTWNADHCGPQEFESRGSKTVFVMESAEKYPISSTIMSAYLE